MLYSRAIPKNQLAASRAYRGLALAAKKQRARQLSSGQLVSSDPTSGQAPGLPLQTLDDEASGDTEPDFGPVVIKLATILRTLEVRATPAGRAALS